MDVNLIRVKRSFKNEGDARALWLDEIPHFISQEFRLFRKSEFVASKTHILNQKF